MKQKVKAGDKTAKMKGRKRGSDLPHIFDRFYRGDTSRSRSTGNTGLGLAIARTIVESHGGEMEVESTPVEGTCFTIRLPLARGGVSTEGAAQPQAAIAGKQ